MTIQAMNIQAGMLIRLNWASTSGSRMCVILDVDNSLVDVYEQSIYNGGAWETCAYSREYVSKNFIEYIVQSIE